MEKNGYFLTKLLNHLNKSALVFSLDVADSCCSALHSGISYIGSRLFGSILHEAISSFGEGFSQGALHAQHMTERGFATVDLAAMIYYGSNNDDKVEDESGGVWDVFKGIIRLVAPLTVISPIALFRAMLAIGHVQATSGKPYPPSDGVPLDLMKHRRLIDILSYRYRQTLAAYDSKVLQLPFLAAGLPDLMGVSEDSILVYQRQSEVHRPAFVLLFNSSENEISLFIRGSSEAADIITDFLYEPDTELGFHSGMLQAARHIDSCVRDKIHKILGEVDAAKVVVGGHSLGGGVAALLAYIWLKDDIIGNRLECFSFGSPCVVPLKVSEKLRGVLTSVIYARDIVSRFNLGSLIYLHRTLLAYGQMPDYIASDISGVYGRSTPITPATTMPNTPVTPTTTTPNNSIHYSLSPSKSCNIVCKDENDLLLCPGGRTLLLVPLVDLQKTSRNLPEYLTPGGCAVFDLNEIQVLELVREPLLHPAALADHFPHRLAAALGLFIPT